MALFDLQSEFKHLNLPIPPLAVVDTYVLAGQSLIDFRHAYGVVLNDAHTTNLRCARDRRFVS